MHPDPDPAPFIIEIVAKARALVQKNKDNRTQDVTEYVKFVVDLSKTPLPGESACCVCLNRFQTNNMHFVVKSDGEDVKICGVECLRQFSAEYK